MVGTRRTRRVHAAKVATVATVAVAVAYVVTLVVLNVVLAHRLIAQADDRVAHRLAEVVHAHATQPAEQVDHDRDLDDAPTLVWAVAPSGRAVALSTGAPSLPTRSWGVSPTTLTLDGTPFRLHAAPRAAGGWFVVGESLAQVDRVRSALVAPEILVGVAIALLTYVGSLTVGLRASAPLELVHRRQVEFTADASHELRTPLSVIEAEVSLALARPRRVEEYRAALARIGGEGDRLRSIVEDLLWLARADDAEAAARGPGQADVGEIAATCARRFRSVAAGRDVTLRCSGTDESTCIDADPEWVDRLVGVLVDNACKFAEPGGAVDVRVLHRGQRVVLQVDDSGPGIDPAIRPQVFDRFHRGAEDRVGTGLGLAIADSVVRATHGAWSLGTSPYGGARMEVSWRRSPTRRGALTGG